MKLATWAKLPLILSLFCGAIEVTCLLWGIFAQSVAWWDFSPGAPFVLRVFCLFLSLPLGLNRVTHGLGVHIEVSGLVLARKALPQE